LTNRKEHFDKWYTELSRSKELLLGYKKGKIGFGLFEKYFYEQLTANEKAMAICKQIGAINLENKSITLLCYEKDESNCHRRCAKNICEKICKK
jgi:uncharacterized protein YeaO (DUF488 family)